MQTQLILRCQISSFTISALHLSFFRDFECVDQQMEERADLLEMSEYQHNNTIEEERKLHNNSEEEEKRLRRQFVAISKLCSSDTTSSTTSCPWNRTSDEVVISLFTQPRTKPIFGNQLFYCLKLQPTDQPTYLLTASTRIDTIVLLYIPF